MSDYFRKVLTLCQSCRKQITVDAIYAVRNKVATCEDCKKKSLAR